MSNSTVPSRKATRPAQPSVSKTPPPTPHHWRLPQLWLALPGFVGGAAWWYALAQGYRGHVGFTAAHLPLIIVFIAIAMLGFGIWMGTIIVAGYVNASGRWALIEGCLVASPLLWFFPMSLWTGVAFVLVVISSWHLWQRSRGEMRSRLTLRPLHSTVGIIGVPLTGILLALSVLYYQQVIGDSRTAEDLSNRLTSQTVTVAERFLPLFLRGYDPNAQLDQVISAQLPSAEKLLSDLDFDRLANQPVVQEQLRERLRQAGVPENNIDLSQPRQILEQQLTRSLQAGTTEISESVRKELASRTGVKFSGDERVHDVVVALVNRQFDNYIRRYVAVVPPLLALAFFFLLRVFSIIFVVGSCIGAWVCYHALRRGGVIAIREESVTAERASWS